MSPASGASSVAAAARLLASRWKPSNRSRLSPSEPEYDVFEGTVTICPVAALYRLVDARLDEPLAVIVGKNAPAAERWSAPAVRTSPRAWTMDGCTSSARRTASASEISSCGCCAATGVADKARSEEHTSELQSPMYLV